MVTQLVLGKPSETFWEAYQHLWENSPERSPFKAPHLLRYFSDVTPDTLGAFVFVREGKLRGAFLLKERRGVCTFLSDLKTDVNTFVLDRRCTNEERHAFYQELLTAIRERGWSFELNNQPAQADYLLLLEAAARQMGMHWLLVPHSTCPMLKSATPADVEMRLQQNHRYRYYANRLRTQEQAVFRAFDQEDALESWVKAYCQAHVQRWANTPTPSNLQSVRQQKFLLHCLRAWHQDGLAVRFSLHLPDERPIAFAIGLRQPPALVFHATTFNPAFARYSPGKALIYHIAIWMAQNGLSVLDFGDGDEPYKYDTANDERPLCRVFICQKAHLTCRAKALFFRYLKAHPRVEHAYRYKIKPLAAKVALLLHALAEPTEAMLAGL